MAKHRRRKQKKRGRVEKVDRVLPPPEAAQHYRPWPLMLLLHKGPEDGGIDADDFEAAVEIVETFRSLTAELRSKAISMGAAPGAAYSPGAGTMSDKAARMTAIWFAWSAEVGPGATRFVEMIDDTLPITSPEILRAALRRWQKVRQDNYRATTNRDTVDIPVPNMLTMNRSFIPVSPVRANANTITRPSPATSTRQGQAAGRTPAQAATRLSTPRK